MPPKRVSVFIDYQNAYRGARESFFARTDPHTSGQFDPLGLGQRIAARPRPAPTEGCVLGEVRVYLGRPDPRKDPRTYTPHMKQCARWTTGGVAVVTRMLRYPPAFPAQRPEEKGIDVALAIDFIAGALDNTYDVGVIFSTDTDLKPALEFVLRRCSSTKTVEVAAWRSPAARPRLSVAGASIWCHYFWPPDFNAIADTTDYNRV